MWLIFLSEMTGIFLFIFWIIMPTSLGFGENPSLSNEFNEIYNFLFSTYFMRALWVIGFLLIILLIFRRVSVNINPAITIAWMFLGKHTTKKGLIILLAQFFGAFLSVITMYYISSSEMINWWGNDGSLDTLGSIYPKLELGVFTNKYTVYDFYVNSPIGIENIYIIINIFLEFLFTLILISAVSFGDNIKWEFRPYFIFFCMITIIPLGLHTNNIALNPARIIACSLISFLEKGENTTIYIVPLLFGELLAVIVSIIIGRKINEQK